MRGEPKQVMGEDQEEHGSDAFAGGVSAGAGGDRCVVRRRAVCGGHYGWYWPWLVLAGTVGVLFVRGSLGNEPRRQRETTESRSWQRYRQLEREAGETEVVRDWRNERISWPRRVVR